MEYKSSHSVNRYKKFAEANRSQLEDTKAWVIYESGVAVKIAIRSLKDASKCNPEGTLPSDWKFPYYHENYCCHKGYHDCCIDEVYMHGVSKEARDEALAFILEEAITFAIEENTTKVKFYFVLYNIIHLFFIVLT